MKNAFLIRIGFSLLTWVFLLSLVTFQNSVFAATADRVEHDYMDIVRDIPLSNACITTTEVRSRRPIRTCVKLERTVEAHRNLEPTPSWTCQAYANVTLAYPRQIDTRICTQYDSRRSPEYDAAGLCVKSEITTRTLPRSIEVRWYPNVLKDEPTETFKKTTFSFPDCP